MAKDSKTSKTARVMNLLSKKPGPAAAAEETAEAPAAAEETTGTPAAPAAAPVPPIVASMAPDAAVSVQIKSALEDALESELGPQQPAAQEEEPAPVPEPEPQPEPEPVQQAAPIPEPAAEPDEPKFKEPLHPVNPGYVNVMQVLVEEKAPKYVQMFGLCSCERCMEDVKAYTLNHLSPKYVVLEPNDRIPRLTVYEGKFASDITAQLLQACKVVMGRPHHGR